MNNPAAFLGGAKDRLLPASVPFRFFLAAAGFHLVAWLVMALAFEDIAQYTGGPGAILSSIHLLTLGVFAMTAVGASYQLLPIATRQPLAKTWPAKLSFWLLAPGIPMLAFGLFELDQIPLYAGTGMVGLGLTVFALLTADNLRRAGSMPVVAAHGWGSLIALVVFIAIGGTLVADFVFGVLDDHQGMAIVHMIVAVFGFMGLLVMGFSRVLIPMFVLSRALSSTPGWVHLALAFLGLVLFGIAKVFHIQSLLVVSILVGSVAAGIYVWVMVTTLRTAMRKRLGYSFFLIKASWVFLLLTLCVGLIVALGLPVPNGETLFGFLLLVGWLLTFLMGILQRIMPFLASMHASGIAGKSPRLSELTPDLPAKIHMICHFAAIGFCIAGILSNLGYLVLVGTGFGFAGSIAFAAFAGTVVSRLSKPVT